MREPARGQAPVTGEVAARRFAFRLASPAGAVLLGGLVLALTVAAVPLGILARQNVGSGGATFVLGPVFAVAGFVVAWRRPRNPLGWLMLGAVAFLVLSGDAGSYVVAGYRLRHGGLPHHGWRGSALWRLPSDALFGRPDPPVLNGVAQQEVCTNPAALAGGTGILVSAYRVQLPTQEVAGSATEGILDYYPAASTPWIQFDDRYRAGCVQSDGANVLMVMPIHNGSFLTAVPNPAWGLHVDDPNLALGTSLILCDLRRPLTSARTGLPREPGSDEAVTTASWHQVRAGEWAGFISHLGPCPIAGDRNSANARAARRLTIEAAVQL